MDRLRSIVVVAVAAAGLLGLGLLGAGEGSADARDARITGAPPMQAGRARTSTTRACSAPLDGFCAIGLEPSAHQGRRSGGATR